MSYLLSCKCCRKKYVGETTDSFRYRLNNYKDNDWKHARNERCMEELLFNNFSSMGHSGFLSNIPIVFIGKTNNKNPKKRGDYGRAALKTCSSLLVRPMTKTLKREETKAGEL